MAGTVRLSMNLSGNGTLAGAVLTNHQHRAVTFRNMVDRSLHLSFDQTQHPRRSFRELNGFANCHDETSTPALSFSTTSSDRRHSLLQELSAFDLSFPPPMRLQIAVMQARIFPE